jgi:hypothetical protein
MIFSTPPDVVKNVWFSSIFYFEWKFMIFTNLHSFMLWKYLMIFTTLLDVVEIFDFPSSLDVEIL